MANGRRIKARIIKKSVIRAGTGEVRIRAAACPVKPAIYYDERKKQKISPVISARMLVHMRGPPVLRLRKSWIQPQ